MKTSKPLTFLKLSYSTYPPMILSKEQNNTHNIANINNRCRTLILKEKFTTIRCYKTCIVITYVVVNALNENNISKEERKNPKKKNKHQ